jgi:hypothetical protein
MTSHIAKLLAAASGESDALLGMVQRFRENFTEYAHTHRAETKNCDRCGGYLVQVYAHQGVYWAHGPAAKNSCSLLSK